MSSLVDGGVLFAYDVHELAGDGVELGAPTAAGPVAAHAPAAAEPPASGPVITEGTTLSDGGTKRARAPPAEITRCGLVLVNAIWFASSFCWFLLLIVIVPSQIAQIVGQERKGEAIGAVLGASTPVVLVGAPLVGVLSDRVRSRYGKRRPLMAPGVLAFCAVLLGLVARPRSLLAYGALYGLLRVAELLISAPFNGLIADLTPPRLRGLASGVMGAASNVGNFAGAAVGVQYTALGPLRVALGMCVVMLAASVATGAAATERSTAHLAPAPALHPRRLALELLSPLRNADFAWVFATRLIFQMGVYTVQEFLQFYFRDAVDLPAGVTPETAVSYGMLCLMTAAVVTAAAGGLLTDLLGGRRKVLVYAAGAIMACACVGVVFLSRSMAYTLVLLTIFGLGYGCYLAVDFAMVLDVLPHPDDAAKDMAVWSIALTLPQMLATPSGGVLLDEFQRIGKQTDPESVLGYKLIFLLAAFYLVLSTVLVTQIKGVK